MASIMKCDICNKPYELYNKKDDPKKPNGFQFFSREKVGRNDGVAYASIDCCPNCMVSIQNHIEYLKLAAREKEGK